MVTRLDHLSMMHISFNSSENISTKDHTANDSLVRNNAYFKHTVQVEVWNLSIILSVCLNKCV